MDRGFYNEDFDLEQLLQQRSDQYRMYPSDKVWRNIRRTIRHARYGYGLALLLLLGGGSYLSYKNDLFTLPSSQRTITLLAPSLAKKEHSPSSLINPVNSQPAEYMKIRKSGTPLTSKMSTAVEKKPSAAKPANTLYPYDFLHAVSMQNIGNALNDPIATLQPLAIHETKSLLEGATVAVFQQQEASQESMPPSVPAEHASTDLSVNDHYQINWLQEKAAYELSRPRSKKLSWQLHATPTVNYRNIVGQKMVNISSELTNIPLALNIQGNIDNLLNHKPAMGFEMGTAVLYALNKRITVKAGAQFNYSSYDIQAYSSTASERATIALSTVMGSESLTSYTNIRNFGGDQLKALKNEYYQLSVPIGMEYTLLGGRRVQLSVAGTFQPTYMLNHDNYLITTDYKNYTREPSLLRRFNLNTSAEAFLSYNMGDMRIQLGPQFRYQIFSSFASRYPLQEHLKEFGFKLGITKSIR